MIRFVLYSWFQSGRVDGRSNAILCCLKWHYLQHVQIFNSTHCGQIFKSCYGLKHPPPVVSRDITRFRFDFCDVFLTPVIADGNPAPLELLEVIRCQCRVHGTSVLQRYVDATSNTFMYIILQLLW